MPLHAHISLKSGKYAQAPNMVIVPADRKLLPVTVVWNVDSDFDYVVGSQRPGTGHEFCVLDDKLNQVQRGDVSPKAKKQSAKAGPEASRTILGGGAQNMKEVDLDLAALKLKNGRTYTLVCKRWGISATTEFVAVHEPKAKVAKAKRKVKRKAKSAAKTRAKPVKKVARRVKKKVAAKKAS